MLIEPDSTLYSYAITRDFGFAPNPFHGVCTLATCKPSIRKNAKVGDWIMGLGGCTLRPVFHKCIMLMKVTEICTFDEYWLDPRFSIKKPCRNGSRVQMLGDNIYHKDNAGNWIQEDSHHSNPDGSINATNLDRDTGSTENVLISDYFFYFGEDAIDVDLDSIEYKSIRGHKKTVLDESAGGVTLISEIVNGHPNSVNQVVADPCQFMDSHKRVDQGTNKIL